VISMLSPTLIVTVPRSSTTAVHNSTVSDRRFRGYVLHWHQTGLVNRRWAWLSDNSSNSGHQRCDGCPHMFRGLSRPFQCVQVVGDPGNVTGTVVGLGSRREDKQNSRISAFPPISRQLSSSVIPGQTFVSFVDGTILVGIPTWRPMRGSCSAALSCMGPSAASTNRIAPSPLPLCAPVIMFST